MQTGEWGTRITQGWGWDPSSSTPPACLPGLPNNTSTQGSEPSCLTSATTEQLRLVARTFSLLTAWRKVLRWEGGVSASGDQGAWSRGCECARQGERDRGALELG